MGMIIAERMSSIIHLVIYQARIKNTLLGGRITTPSPTTSRMGKCLGRVSDKLSYYSECTRTPFVNNN